jgi:hypothetical protein
MAVRPTKNYSVQIAQRTLRPLSVSTHHSNVHSRVHIREWRMLEETRGWVLPTGDRRTRTKSCGCSTRRPSHLNFFAGIPNF